MLLVHSNGARSWLRASVYRSMGPVQICRKSDTLKSRSTARVRTLNHNSTCFSHESWVGV